MQRHLALFALLGGTDVQSAVVEVDVRLVERQRLAGAQAADGQQPDQRLEGRGAQSWRQVLCGLHQRHDLRLGVQVGSDPRPPSGQQVRGRNLGLGVDRADVASEAAHHPEPLAPAVRAGVLGELRPRDRELAGDP